MTGDSAQESERLAKDSMGEVLVPCGALFGAQTVRAANNFKVSGIRFPRRFIWALGAIKSISAKVNAELGCLDPRIANAVASAAGEVAEGLWDKEFIVEVFQTGSGTSTNMNANEVIARRAEQIMGGSVRIHPNDCVNFGQSSNDVIPTAIHLAIAFDIAFDLIPELKKLEEALKQKASEFSDIVKTGRTHLQDATPITLGQEFSGFASQVAHSAERLERSLDSLGELALGGTAVGTGINTHPEFARNVIKGLSALTGIEFREARNHFEAQAAKDGLLEVSGQLRVVAQSLGKIANDIRWLASGPRCGLGELMLPAVQPGSSIMPGKVNPVIIESLLMIVAKVIGNDATVSLANLYGSNFQLNTMMPLIAVDMLQSVSLLSRGSANFRTLCLEGIRPNLSRINELLEANISVCTALAPKIGYDKAAEIAKEAYERNLSVRQVATEHQVLSQEELDRVLDFGKMTKAGV